MLADERWPIARLIPITSGTGVEARERNAASALLAVLSVAEEFGSSLLKPLGAPTGKIEAFVEVPFKLWNTTPDAGHLAPGIPPSNFWPGDRFADLVRRTYRVLLTRGLKGCYVDFEDRGADGMCDSTTDQRAKGR